MNAAGKDKCLAGFCIILHLRGQQDARRLLWTVACRGKRRSDICEDGVDLSNRGGPISPKPDFVWGTPLTNHPLNRIALSHYYFRQDLSSNRHAGASDKSEP